MSDVSFAELTKTATELDYEQRVELLNVLAQTLYKNKTELTTPKKRKFGSAKGKFVYPKDFDEDNEEIAHLFGAV